MYDVPSRADMARVIVNRGVVEDDVNPSSSRASPRRRRRSPPEPVVRSGDDRLHLMGEIPVEVRGTCRRGAHWTPPS